MGDDQGRACVVLQKLLQPFHRFDVEMVRRLVEQQHVAALAQQLGETDLGLLPSAQQGKRRRQMLRRDAQSLCDLRHLGLPLIAVQLLKVLLQLLVAVHQAFQLIRRFGHLGHLPLEAAHFLLQLVHFCKRAGDDVLPAPFLRIDRGLRQVCPHAPFCPVQLARIRCLDAGQQLEQRRLAGAIRTDDADPFSRFDLDGDILQDGVSPVRFLYMLCRNYDHVFFLLGWAETAARSTFMKNVGMFRSPDERGRFSQEKAAGLRLWHRERIRPASSRSAWPAPFFS